MAQSAVLPQDEPGTAGGPAGLSDIECRALLFERLRWRRASAKDDAIRAQFGVSPAAYYLLLRRLIATDAAMAFDPLLVQRLQRRIDEGAGPQTGRVG